MAASRSSKSGGVQRVGDKRVLTQGPMATGGTVDVPKAMVKMVSADGVEKIALSDGRGLVNAAYKAVNKIIKIPNVVREYTTSVTEGDIDAIATTRVVVDVTADASNRAAIHALTGNSFSGRGESRDIVVSSVTAYLNALNKICSLIDSSVRADDELQALKEENARLKEENTRLKEYKDSVWAWYEDVCRATAHLQNNVMSAPECVRGPRAPAGNI